MKKNGPGSVKIYGTCSLVILDTHTHTHVLHTRVQAHTLAHTHK